MADNTSQGLADNATTYQINLLRVEAGMRKQTLQALETLEGDLIATLEKNKNLAPGKKKQLQAALSAAQQQIHGAYKQIGKKNVADLENLAFVSTKKTASDLGGALGVSMGPMQLSANQAASIARGPVLDGNPIEDWWTSQADKTTRRVLGEVRQGMFLGEGIEELTRRIRGTKANDYKDGITNGSKHEAESIIRTAVQSVSNTARIETIQNASEAVKGIEWVSTLDNRTTATCRALDGLQWSLPDYNPIGHDKKFPGPIAHWGCRSTQIAVTRSWAELAGKDLPEVDTEGKTYQDAFENALKAQGKTPEEIAKIKANQRASMDGTVSAGLDFDKWARTKGDDYIRSLLGPGRFALWKDNKLTMRDLTDQRGRELTIKQLEAAIDGGAIPPETEGFTFNPVDQKILQAAKTSAADIEKQAAAATAKIQQIIDAPGKGEFLKNKWAKKIVADQPDLTPQEQLAAINTAAKQEQAAKTLYGKLNGAKKKILAGSDPTPAQSDALTQLKLDDPDAFENWRQGLSDAQAADTKGQLTKAVSGLETIDVTATDLDPFEAIDAGTKKAIAAIEASDDAEAKATLGAVQSSIQDKWSTKKKADLLTTMESDFTGTGKHKLTPAQLKLIDKLGMNDTEEVLALDKTLTQGSTALDIADEVTSGKKPIFKGEDELSYLDQDNEFVQDAKMQIGIYQATESIKIDIQSDYIDNPNQFEKAAYDKFKTTFTVSPLEDPQSSKTWLETYADEVAQDWLKENVLDGGPGTTQLKQKAFKAQTGVDPSTFSPDDLVPWLENEGFGKLDAGSIDLATAVDTIAKEKQQAGVKSSKLSKAKKKLVEGKKPAPSEQAFIDDLDDTEKAAWLATVEEAKQAAGNVGAVKAAATNKAGAWNAPDPADMGIGPTVLDKLEIDKANALIANLNDTSETKTTPSTAYAKADQNAAAATDPSTSLFWKGVKAEIGKTTGLTDHYNLVEIESFETGKDPLKLQAYKEVIGDSDPNQAADKADLLMELDFAYQAANAQDLGEKVLDAGKNVTQLKKKAFQDLTGIDPTGLDPFTFQESLETAGYEPEDMATLNDKVTATAEAAQAQKTLAGKLNAAKKKLVAGQPVTPAQTKALADLHKNDHDAWAAFQASVADAKKAAGKPSIPAQQAPPKATPPPASTAQKKVDSARKINRPKITVDQESIPEPDTLKIGSGLGGSTGAKLATDKSGKKWVVKRGASPDHVRAEQQADDAYRALGLAVPNGRIFETDQGPVKVTEFLEGGRLISDLPHAERERAYRELRKTAAADMVLGNWDVLGASYDNAMVAPDGTLYRIDNGGALEFRAMGDQKQGTEWNDYPTEIWSMRDPGVNTSASAALQDMDIYEIAAVIEQTDLDRLADLELPEATKTTLLRRASEARRTADRARQLQRDNWTVEYAEAHLKESLEMREEGVLGAVHARMNVTSQSNMTNEDGVKWGGLRTPYGGANAAQAKPKVAGDVYSDKIETAYKSINHKAVNSSDITEGTALTKANTALALKPDLQTLAKSSSATAEQKAMAKKYIKDLVWIENQVKAGGIPKALTSSDFFHAYKPKKTAPKPAVQDTRTVVARWEARMQAKGISTAPVTTWLGSQSSNSWNPSVQAAKYAFSLGLDGSQQNQYWGGNPQNRTSYAKCKKQFEDVAKQVGGEAKARELFTSYHAMIQETLNTFVDVPWVDHERRAVLLHRTVSDEELKGSGVPNAGTGSYTPKKGEYTPYRGVTESHSIYDKTFVKGNRLTTQAVPFTRVHGMYWLERSGGAGGDSFLGDGEAEFAANTSGIPALYDNGYSAPAISGSNSSDASKWGVPISHLPAPEDNRNTE